MKKAMSLLLALAMCVGLAIPAFAVMAPAGAATMDPISEEFFNDPKEFRQSVESVIESDSSALSEIGYATAADKWILLKDAEGTDYAYLVPLTDATDGVIGYSVVSFVGGAKT